LAVFIAEKDGGGRIRKRERRGMEFEKPRFLTGKSTV
jgi:hypothetical protein